MSKKFLKNELNTFKGMGRYLRQHFQIILRSQTIGERARDFDDDLPRKRMNAFEWKEAPKGNQTGTDQHQIELSANQVYNCSVQLQSKQNRI